MSHRKINLDAWGMGVSLACAIHCLVLPLAIATLPVLGINILHNAKFEYGMIGLAFGIGILALRHGYRKHHRRSAPALVFTAGMLLLVGKQLWPGWEIILLLCALPLLVGAHVWNYRLTRAFS